MPSYDSGRSSNLPVISLVIVGICMIVGLVVVWGSWYQIYPQEVGVITRNGKISGVATPGLNFKVPMIDDVHRISIQPQTFTWDKMNSYSNDQQETQLRVSVTFKPRLDRIQELYANYGTLQVFVSRVLSPVVNRDAKIVFGQFTAQRAIQERGKLNSATRELLDQAMKDEPVTLESVQVESIDFSSEYLKSIEKRMAAEVEVAQIQQNVLREKQLALITTTKAQAEADAVVARAKAHAQSIELQGEAEAKAIKARSDALANSPNLVQLTAAEKWNGVLPSTMVPGGATPFVNVGGVTTRANGTPR